MNEPTAKQEPTPLLAIKNLNVNYGAIQALVNIDLAVYAGEIVTLIGANGAGKSTIFKVITQLNESGVTILLVEQNANLALQSASRGYVLEAGNLVLKGTSKALLNNERVRQAYLG